MSKVVNMEDYRDIPIWKCGACGCEAFFAPKDDSEVVCAECGRRATGLYLKTDWAEIERARQEIGDE